MLSFVGEAARYLSYLERRELLAGQDGGSPARMDLPGQVSFAVAAAFPLAVSPMMMLRPPGEVTVWLAGSSFLWCGAFVLVGLLRLGAVRDERREVIDLSTADVIDLRDGVAAQDAERASHG